MTGAVGIDPTAHRPDHIGFLCEFCGNLTDNPTRCPGWLGHRTRQVYRVESWQGDELGWEQASSTQDTVKGADERLAALRRRFPDVPLRIVAETATYMVIRTSPAEPDVRTDEETSLAQAQGQTPPSEGDQLE